MKIFNPLIVGQVRQVSRAHFVYSIRDKNDVLVEVGTKFILGERQACGLQHDQCISLWLTDGTKCIFEADKVDGDILDISLAVETS